MTLEELNARSNAIDECLDILIDTFFESDYENPYMAQMYGTLRDRYRKLRSNIWQEYSNNKRNAG